MNNAKKMLLIEPDLIEKLKQQSSTNSPTSRLDVEMQSILNSKSDDREKYILYLQTLQRYLHFTTKDRQPYRLPIVTSEVNSNFTDTNDVYKSNSMEDKRIVDTDLLSANVKTEESVLKNPIYTSTQILSVIPKTYTKKGELLLDLISSSKNKITWDNQGTVIIDNEKIPGSNIIDLVNDTLRSLKRNDPIGWEQFAKALKDIKTPLSYIGNPKRSEYMNELQLKEIEKQLSPPTEQFSTPPSQNTHSKKIKKKLDWEKWTPY